MGKTEQLRELAQRTNGHASTTSSTRMRLQCTKCEAFPRASGTKLLASGELEHVAIQTTGLPCGGLVTQVDKPVRAGGGPARPPAAKAAAKAEKRPAKARTPAPRARAAPAKDEVQAELEEIRTVLAAWKRLSPAGQEYLRKRLGSEIGNLASMLDAGGRDTARLLIVHARSAKLEAAP